MKAIVSSVQSSRIQALLKLMKKKLYMWKKYVSVTDQSLVLSCSTNFNHSVKYELNTSCSYNGSFLYCLLLSAGMSLSAFFGFRHLSLFTLCPFSKKIHCLSLTIPFLWCSHYCSVLTESHSIHDCLFEHISDVVLSLPNFFTNLLAILNCCEGLTSDNDFKSDSEA